MQVQKEWLDFLREQYPKGSRIRLTEMKDDPYALSPGSMGTLDHIDDAGQFHVKWDNGSGLALIIGEDRFQVQLPEPQTLKFYMPITAQLYGRDSWGDLEEYGNDLNGRDLRDYGMDLARKEGVLGQDPLLNQCFDSVAYAQHHMAKYGLSTTDHGYAARNEQEIIYEYSQPEHEQEMTM